MTGELLTRRQVANLAGYTPRYIPRWAADRGVPAVALGDRTYYRADDVDKAIRAERKGIPGPLRLARFIRNPLNHTALDKLTTTEETPA